MRHLLWPLALLYSIVSRIRNFAYDKKLFKSDSIKTPILSVGNITAGGTGKTPIIAEIIEWCMKENIKVGVISRGYKGNYSGVVKVNGADLEKGPEFYGDEPYMLALRYPNVPIYLCPQRVRAAQALETHEQVDFIVADDAFQHRQLQRSYDLVVLDMMEPLENYLPLPVGRARESLSSLHRAQFVVLNKVNLGTAENLVSMVKLLNQSWSDRGNIPNPRIVESKYGLLRILKPDFPEVIWMKSSEPVMLLSGIGNPKSFEKMMQQEGISFSHHFILPDHAEYSLQTVKNILESQRSCGAKQILTTEKDFVKLRQYPDLASPLWVAKLGVQFSESAEGMYAILRRDLR
ncbi:MAG: tetraacyldisaccharide 4'-kinase [Bdellovibrionales bacterium]|nr:tetraacyldisaccharide 4'-kinase [Bdellovibrionales bacterium]